MMFKSMVTGEMFRVLVTGACKTSNVIYLIQCSKCNEQMWGNLNPLHIRLNGHRSDIKSHQTEKQVAAHFNLVAHSIGDLRIMLMKKVHRENVLH